MPQIIANLIKIMSNVFKKRIMSLIRIRSKNRNAQSIKKFIKENLLKSFNVLKKDLLISIPKKEYKKKWTLIN